MRRFLLLTQAEASGGDGVVLPVTMLSLGRMTGMRHIPCCLSQERHEAEML